MSIALGIDTGGTYTDAALVNQESGQVLVSAKALTTYHDLAIGISQAIEQVLFSAPAGIRPADIEMASLSTTLATNAIVEGRGSGIALLLIGYDPQLIEDFNFGQELVTQNVRFIRGGHTIDGQEQESLDEAALLAAISDFRDQVDAFAISGYFSVLNPEHELRARELVIQHTRRADGRSAPVTCGHELTSRLNSVRRATTTALNARLIPLLTDLITTVRQMLDRAGVQAPLMVVKGDGSLVRADWAMQRPIETILSGPAASVVGASHLARLQEVWVVDMGGTTTDIAGLREGLPGINPRGAQVGRWRTMVEAIDVYTEGLGGDSLVSLNGESEGASPVHIGPRRVLPLSALAAHHPEIVEVMRHQIKAPNRFWHPGQFALLLRPDATGLTEEDRELLTLLADGPLSVDELIYATGLGNRLMIRLESLMARFIVQLAAFTPTDALHVLGYFQRWDAEAARLGAQFFADALGVDVETFCQQVIDEVGGRAGMALINKVLGDENLTPNWQREPTARALLQRMVGRSNGSSLLVEARLDRPIVAIGAPVTAYLPRTAALLHTDLIIPDHADVANAVGAVAASVVQRRTVSIQPVETPEDELYRVYLPDGIRKFAKLEEAVTTTRQEMEAFMIALTRAAGADHVEVKCQRRDVVAPLEGGWSDEIWLETTLSFTAIGRPALR